MDFSFVEGDVSGRRSEQRQPQPQPQPQGNQQPPRPLIQLPSWQEVQAANRPSAPTILFRPTGLLASVRQQQQQQQQQQPHHGAGPPAAAAAAGPTEAAGYGAGPGQQAGGAGQQQVAGQAGPGVPYYGSGLGGGSAAGWGGGAGGGGGGTAAGYGPPRPVSGPGPAPPFYSGSGGGGGTPAFPGPGPAGPPPAAAPPPPPNVVLVNRRQQGNPVLKHIRNVRWQFADIVPDYQLGQNTAALFLSLRYHLLHPDYVLHRIREQQRLFRLTVLLLHVDVEDVVKPLGEVTRAAVFGDCTLVCAWSPEECARWLETYKSYESKPASAIQERVEPDYVSRLAAVLAGSVRGVNRTDAHSLGTAFGSLAAMMRCKDPEAFSACPGIGPTKVRRLMEAFHEPFRKQLKMTGLGAAAAAGAVGGTAAGAQAAAAAPAAATGAGGGNGGGGGTAGAGAAPSGSAPSHATAGGAATGTGAAGGSGRVDVGSGIAGQAQGQGLVTGPQAMDVDGRVQEGPAAVDVDNGTEGTGVGEGYRAGVPGQEQQQQEGVHGRVEARRQLLEMLMSQMPAGDDDDSDADDGY